jgi:peptidylamidoglycolate lyase
MFCINNNIPFLFLITFFFITCNPTKNNQTKKGANNVIKYEWVKDWPQLPAGYTLSQVTGVDIDTSQNLFLFHRTGRVWTEPFPDSLISQNTILLIDRESGKMINSWGGGYFIMPHGLTVDKNNNVWVTDVALHQIFKFDHDGNLLMKLGIAKEKGNDATHFNLPTDIAVANDGSFYVSDGYGNSRVVKFSKEGKYISEWGKRGNNQGEFHTPHGIDLDTDGNVYVADRDNNRIQKFDANGKFLKEWKNDQSEQLYSLSLDPGNNNVLAIDYLTFNKIIVKGSDIIQFDSDLIFKHRFGRSGSYEGPICRYHDITIDNKGNIYLGDILKNSIQKFRKSGR